MRRSPHHLMREMMYDELRRVVLSKMGQQPSSAHIRLIDVRRYCEAQHFGGIPTALQIPIKVLQSVLQSNPEHFYAAYGETLPHRTKDILVFFCHRGELARTACELAEDLGFSTVLYGGGYAQWLERESKQKATSE